jgi:UDP-N-acetyl-D-glucosamine dehydrogenase
MNNGNAIQKIGIIGMGYVGLPLAASFAKAGLSVTGFEIDKAKIAGINAGVSYIQDISSRELKPLAASKKLTATGDFSKLKNMDAIIICVPTPLRKSKDPDISYIVSAVNALSPCLKRGQLIILESTTYPGTTREIILPRLTQKGFKPGRDFYLAFSPERVDPGNKKYGIENTPKIVGGITPECARRARDLYARVVRNVVVVSSTEAAEMVKLLENTFRAVNIGLVNEVALMCDRLKLDVWEVIDAAATKPFGYMPFYPGPGLGGHCIPLDPHYLSWKLKTLNFYARFIELAGEINSHMPEFLVRKVSDALNARGQAVKGARILVLGMAYKKDIGDLRESPALDVFQLLAEKGARVVYHDPYVKNVEIGGKTHKSAPLTAGALKAQDAVVVTTDHTAFDKKFIVAHARLIIDARNLAKGVKSDRVIRL